jgi:type IX secretion system PorP/SprF family membrane protein
MEMKSITLSFRLSMKKQLTSLLAALLFALNIQAQQDPMYSMYMFNMMAINPAYAGTNDHVVATGLFRRQWLNFPGSPQTATFTAHAPMKNEKVGLGISFINDRLGDMSTNAAMAAYSYHLRFRKSRLSLGLQAGARNFNINLSELKLSPVYQYDDAFANNINTWSFNFGTGLFWYSDKYYLGVSLPHIQNNILSNQQLNTVYVARLRTHVNVAGGYVFTINPMLKLKPSFLVKHVGGAPVQIDLNANVYWLDVLSIGASYRSVSAFVLMVEVQLNKTFRLGYAYDQTTNRMRGYTGGTHEIMLRVDAGFNKNRTITPRYF